MNYTTYTVLEASQLEMTKTFILSLKQMDTDLARKRLNHILCSNASDASFLSIIGQFTSLVGHETSAD